MKQEPHFSHLSSYGSSFLFQQLYHKNNEEKRILQLQKD
ncbi:hypothetical protein M075_3991 [Bacteroides fragilis str. 20793-3]|nr:hypothetical protein M075_3991 [Bacteroides fragilis str. 20793-3]EYA65010.1 hypothetical protein M139_3868 [Bacteroides fragilis str. S23L24]